MTTSIRLAALLLLASLGCMSGAPEPPPPAPGAGPPAEATEPEAVRGARRDRPRRRRADEPVGGACDVSAFVVDPDPKGLNVRDAPGGKVVGQLVKGTMVHLREAKDGWVRYDEPSDFDRGSSPPGSGWVSANLLGIDLKTPDEYGPDAQPVLRSAPESGARSRPITLQPRPSVELVGCSGSFWEVEVSDGRTQRGFLGSDSACGHPETTCS